MDIHYVKINVSRVTGDGKTPTAPQTLKEVTYVFLDAKKFEYFLDGLEWVFLSKAAKSLDADDHSE